MTANANQVQVKQVYRITINAPIRKVWDALTRTGEPLPFFFGSVMHTTTLGPGAPIRMRTPDGKFTGVVGEVLEFDPPHRFSHTFKFTSLDDAPCRVTYELVEVDGAVQFTLTSEGITAGTKSEKYMKQGSEFIGATLKALCETGRPTLKQRLMLAMMSATAFTSPKRSRSEHWPLDGRIS